MHTFILRKKLNFNTNTIIGWWSLINNAGIIHNSLLQMTAETNISKNIEVNFIGPYILTQYVTKLMTRNAGAGG